MATTARARTPAHLWIIGILALLWNAFGCYDYWMTETANQAYLSQYPPEIMTYMSGLPKWTTAAWALGVWGGLAGSILLLARSRYALLAYLLSAIGAVAGLGYEMFLTQMPASMKTGAMAAIPWIAILIALFLLWYSWNAEKRGLLS